MPANERTAGNTEAAREGRVSASSLAAAVTLVAVGSLVAAVGSGSDSGTRVQPARDRAGRRSAPLERDADRRTARRRPLARPRTPGRARAHAAPQPSADAAAIPGDEVGEFRDAPGARELADDSTTGDRHVDHQAAATGDTDRSTTDGTAGAGSAADGRHHSHDDDTSGDQGPTGEAGARGQGQGQGQRARQAGQVARVPGVHGRAHPRPTD